MIAFKTGIQGVQVSSRGAKVTFSSDLTAPCTVSTSAPFSAPGVHAFEVHMPIKQARTAVGLVATPCPAYLTPSYMKGRRDYVSMGGAGFIYPEQRSSGSSYGEGDSIRCEIDFDRRLVAFYINGQPAGRAVAWHHGDQAFPAISSEGGTVVCNVDFE